MANRGTVTYNGKTISTEDRDGSFSVTYNSKTLATIGAGSSKTLKCSGKVMTTDVVVGGKTLKCAGKLMTTDVVIAVVSLFPSAPSAYNLIGTYTANQTWTAPENGYFQIEVFGASGSGGDGSNTRMGTGSSNWQLASGGGGGGGGYSASRVTLNKDDTVVLTVGGVGSISSAVVNSSYNNSHDHTLSVTSGANGGAGSTSIVSKTAGSGGAGGTASGGNYANYNGGAGSNGSTAYGNATSKNVTGGTGGTAGYSGGTTGGAGGDAYPKTNQTGVSGSAGFFKIYRGNTNLNGTPSNSIPSNYTALSYIQSTGTQFIDTGYTFTSSNIKIQCKWKDNVTSSATVVFGTGKDGTGSTDKGFLAIYEDDLYIGSGSTGFISTLNISDTSVPHEFALEVRSNNTLSYTLDGTTSSGTYTGAINQIYPLYVLNQYPHNTRIRKANLYYFRIYDNDVLIRDYVPCKNEKGEVGMYDLANSIFYGNAGSGTFTAG